MSKYRYLYYLAYLAELKMHQRKSREELVHIQLKKLRRIIKHAYEYVPYYRELFDKTNLAPENIRTLDDLRRIPITTKRDIQANYGKIIACNADVNRCKVEKTTGSTGVPLDVYVDRKAAYYSGAAVLYAFLESGLRPGEKFIEITASAKGTSFLKHSISLYDPPEKLVEQMGNYGHAVFYSFPSVFKTISQSLNGNAPLCPRLIFTHGETLTDSCRRTINSAFSSEVFNTYGSTEFNRLAFECNEHLGLHMITDCAVMEFVRDGESAAPGEQGEIIVTGLYNYTMPLIRYNLGDAGTAAEEECTCGRHLPLIRSIEGRTDDFLVLPSGRVISPRNINVIEGIPGILQYRTVQERKDRFVVSVVPGSGFSPETPLQVEKKIRLGCLGEDISVEVKIVGEIPRERTGKIKTVISNVR